MSAGPPVKKFCRSRLTFDKHCKYSRSSVTGMLPYYVDKMSSVLRNRRRSMYTERIAAIRSVSISPSGQIYYYQL